MKVTKEFKGVRVERYPFYIVKENKPRCDEKLAKVFNVDSFFLITFKIDP